MTTRICRAEGEGRGEGGEKSTVRGGAQRGEEGTLRDRRWGREGGGGREWGRGEREPGRRRRRRRMPEEREREATAVCAPLSHETTTVHKSLSLVVQLREAVRDTIRKKKKKKITPRSERNKQKATQTLVVSIRFSPMCCIPRNKPR